MKKLNHAHYLLACRFDNWLRLLSENRFNISRENIPEALYITLASLGTFPFAMAEKLIYDRAINNTVIDKHPIYILGHWRTGTTHLQNVLSRDPQFGWCDPVSTTTFNNSLLMGPLMAKIQSGVLDQARPMDNMKYGLDMPMEEIFAQATISDIAIIHMMRFPQRFREHVPLGFLQDLPAHKRQRWMREYQYVLKKITYIKNGRQLVLKSPDNTCHPRIIHQMFPKSKYICLHRGPYTTIFSTINMFKKQMEVLSLQDPPSGALDIVIEDAVIDIFRRMYTELFDFLEDIPKSQYTELPFEHFEKEPIDDLRRIYTELNIGGFEEALPYFQKYLDSQRDYKKNSFDIPPRLYKKINEKLGFYFDRYGYEMAAPNTGGSV